MSASKNGSTSGLPIDIPDTSLAKPRGGPAEGSKEWMREMVAEHGDTDEEKLQKRRERLSALTVLVDRGLKKMQFQKKAFIGESGRLIDTLRTALGKAKKDSEEFVNISAKLAEVQLNHYQQEAYFDNLITTTTVQLASVEASCLQIDCNSIREEVTSKNGKTGYVRYSAALILDSISTDVYRTYRRTRKLYDILALKFPECVPQVDGVTVDDSDDGGEEHFEVTDEEISTPAERQAIRKQVTEEAL